MYKLKASSQTNFNLNIRYLAKLKVSADANKCGNKMAFFFI